MGKMTLDKYDRVALWEKIQSGEPLSEALLAHSLARYEATLCELEEQEEERERQESLQGIEDWAARQS